MENHTFDSDTLFAPDTNADATTAADTLPPVEITAPNVSPVVYFAAELLPATTIFVAAELLPPDALSVTSLMTNTDEGRADNAAFSHSPGPDKTSTTPVLWRARLFVAGHYPDRALTIAAADLDTLITRFYYEKGIGKQIPVLAEHRESPLDPLGTVESLWRVNDELFGLLAFSPAMAAHLSGRPDARKLSVCLQAQEDAAPSDTSPSEHLMWRLKEVSLVANPRIPQAALLFGATPTFTGRVVPAERAVPAERVAPAERAVPAERVAPIEQGETLAGYAARFGLAPATLQAALNRH